ncbi:cyclophilin type peptidyl-prolyl cis-trans isomerase [Planoprotostelium fungivorum]|uniref:Cyclophilin type peptidyl-prolyl cis-trans isomerase n=1 Tax=Planoprotostelium fungivorum TaxID=1890364 RepID=A0A2P6N5Y1_9EUKA|nr:cyclophilin type peptidyl-prolyl cis-trans isomerase [Planoprotostelium fungivorum]
MRSFFLLLLSFTCIYASQAPAWFIVDYQTTVAVGDGIFSINFTRAAAPLGVDHMWELLHLPNGGYYKENGFFRVVSGFVVQFGIAAEPSLSAQWKDQNIQDDPVALQNKKMVISYATSGANTRTTQLFINYADNLYLDGMGFSGIGIVTKGWEVVEGINPQYGQQPDQGKIYSQGDKYLKSKYPKLDYIQTATVSKTAADAKAIIDQA